MFVSSCLSLSPKLSLVLHKLLKRRSCHCVKMEHMLHPPSALCEENQGFWTYIDVNWQLEEVDGSEHSFDSFYEVPQRRDVSHLEPLAPRLKDVSPQPFCPLFNGLIAPEIRMKIFEYVLTENDFKEYNNNNHYSRPGYRSQKSIFTNLLLTCRRVYLEAHHLPLINKEHIFWHYREPYGISYEDEASYFSRFRPDQLALVRNVHLFTQQFWLEGSLQRTCKLHVLQGIEKLKITLRRGDWWFWENGAELGINPQRGNADVKKMNEDWKTEEEGQVIPWEDHAWGSSFRHLPALKQLDMEFETSVYEEEELRQIVEHAKKWRFPMSNDPKTGVKRVLSAEGQSIGKRTWRGPLCVWSRNCPLCGKATVFAYTENVEECKVCKDKVSLIGKNMGPMLVVFSLRWKIAAAEGHDCV
jgi:hypothetical protein